MSSKVESKYFKSEKSRKIKNSIMIFLIILITMYFFSKIFEDQISNIIIEVSFTIIGTFFALYFTIEIFFPRFRNQAKYRLINSKECVDFYKKVIKHPNLVNSMISLNDLKTKAEDVIKVRFFKSLKTKKIKKVFPEKIPVILEDTYPFIEIDKIQIKLKNDFYKLPMEIELLFDPVIEKIKEQFRVEGHFNKLKVKLEKYDLINPDKIKLTFSKTSYYYTFITNFFADYWLYGSNKTYLRKDIDYLIFQNDKLIPFEKSKLSNHLGIGGLIITEDGKTLIPKRNVTVAVGVNMLDNSFGGSIDLNSFYKETSFLNPLVDSLIDQVKDEIKIKDISNFKIKKIYIIGLIRNLVWLGKPDLLAIVITDKIPSKNLQTIKDDYRYFDDPIVDLKVDKIRNIYDLLKKENHEKIMKKLIQEIYKKSDFRTKPSPVFLSSIYLLNKLHYIVNKKN